ncbi:MAG: hypothetical protein ACRDCT_30990, partial [Shewanella sp.]
MDGELAVKHGCCSSLSVYAGPPVCCEWIHKCRGGMDAKERPWCANNHGSPRSLSVDLITLLSTLRD